MQERAPETFAEKITANTPVMIILTIGAAVGTILAVVGGYYSIYKLVGFLSNTLGV